MIRSRCCSDDRRDMTSDRRTPIEALCAALHSGGSSSRRSRAHAQFCASRRRFGRHGRGHQVTTAPADRLPARSGSACAPFPCRYCGGEFVSTPDQDCRIVRKVRRKAAPIRSEQPGGGLRLPPSPTETLGKSAGKTVPTVPSVAMSGRAKGTVQSSNCPSLCHATT
jgi:hypothetical protein